MKQICVFLVFSLLTSCEYFNVKKTSSEAILEEELQSFNWNQVDTYPTFSSCDSSATKTEKRQCFENTLASFFTNQLQQETIIVTQDITDTIVLQIQVSEQGHLTLLNLKVDSLTQQEIPNIESMLKNSLNALPKIYPALKRGQQVKTEFNLPIAIQVN
jgi:hypothetical protein